MNARKPSILKQALKQNHPTFGSWITLDSPAIAEIMANAGFDWLTVDMEHSSLSMSRAGELIRVIELAGSQPLVRLSSNDSVQIKRVMDAGAHGIIVPMVNTPEEAEAAARAMHYPPKGGRGVGLFRAQGYGHCFAEYKTWLADNAVLIAQIEHIRAVENLEGILAVDDVDGVIIGPYDLSGSMGIPGRFDSKEFAEAVERVRETTLASGKALGIHVIEPEPETLATRLAEGYTFISYSLDIRMLDATARLGLAEAKKFSR